MGRNTNPTHWRGATWAFSLIAKVAAAVRESFSGRRYVLGALVVLALGSVVVVVVVVVAPQQPYRVLISIFLHCTQYHDPYYSGGSIGEYQYYDLEYDYWDTSTCRTGRCAKMDCHDSSTHWQLVGVFKESVDMGNDNFFEQLYKHEGYCVWNGDKGSSDYEFMQEMREAWQQDCEQLSDITSSSGRSYYVGTKPEAGGKFVIEMKCARLFFARRFGLTTNLFSPPGNMTYGVYTDSNCKYESGYSYADYQKVVSGTSAASSWTEAFDRWNSLLNSYKICQPCRAYNRVQTYDSNYGSRRHLAEDEDGQGEEEQWGYNCYDDAGYRK